MGVLVFDGLCWIGWQIGGWNGWMDGLAETGHGLANMVFGDVCLCGVLLFLGFRGDRFGEGESLLEVWCLYLNAENANSSLTFLSTYELAVH